MDIDNESGARYLKFTNDAPDWRTVEKDGLCLEGKCSNSNCVAFEKWVLISKGMGNYDMIFDDSNNKCPMCGEYVKVTKCAFTNCSYSYTGVKKG